MKVHIVLAKPRQAVIRCSVRAERNVGCERCGMSSAVAATAPDERVNAMSVTMR
jgi:hypothetical protein